MNKNKEYKVFVVGLATSYASWIQGKLTRNMEEADVVLFTGGEDISPKIYNEQRSKTVHIWDVDKSGYSRRDLFELEMFKEAQELGKPMWGTCRGAQLLCALAGGKLVQDMDHSGSHRLYFYDKEFECTSNSLHHQLQYPYTIPRDEYKILAHAHGLSSYFTGGDDKPMKMVEKIYKAGVGTLIKEPEFVYYSKLKALGIQGHPEMMHDTSTLVVTCHAFLNLLIENKLDDVLLLNLKVDNIIKRAWDFSFTSEEKELISQVKKTSRELEVEVKKEETSSTVC